MRYRIPIIAALLAMIILAACQPVSSQTSDDLAVIATTSIVADVVRQVGGDSIEVITLLPLGSDPHSFQPAPRDMARVADASVIFANGAGLEEFLEPLIENAGAGARVVEVSAGITLIDTAAEEEDADDSHRGDPHTWVDPNNVLLWVANVGAALTQAQLRLSVVDYSKVTGGTPMPSFHKAPAGSDRPILTASEIEDVVAYLSSLKSK